MSRAPLRYHQPMTTATRVVLAIAASIPLLGFYELLIGSRMSWWQWGMAPFLVMGFAALGFGLFFLSVAIFGGSRTVVIDRTRRALIVTFDGTFGITREFVHPFATLSPVMTREMPSSDGPGNWSVELPVNGKGIIVHTYAEQARAEAEAKVIATYMTGG